MQRGAEAVDGLVVLARDVEEHAQAHLHVRIDRRAPLDGRQEEVHELLVPLGLVDAAPTR